ncbi:HNH endonuclease [Dialister succinatiphilus]|uniref:HNH endonuclease n=1 Tax=Dialister succinatiphilus TaxID=487173 RepID=UPI0040261C23
MYNYRRNAYRNYPHKCAVCGWDEDEDILEVHHIDENREHNELFNLIILCPICHRKLSSHKYKLVNREQIVLN